MANVEDLESVLGTQFRDRAILKEALTHRSYINENPSWPLPHNERLEYLGDAVLELIVTEFLYEKFPQDNEGRLTSLRAALVNYQMLSRVARDIKLEKYLYLSKGEAKDIGKAREVILANAIEALFGAIYLDQGYGVSKRVIANIVFPHLDEIIEKGLDRDPKSFLQEQAQELFKVTPVYKVLREEGPDHQKEFFVGVYFNDELFGEGSGTSKQEAESKSAEDALLKLKDKKNMKPNA